MPPRVPRRPVSRRVARPPNVARGVPSAANDCTTPLYWSPMNTVPPPGENATAWGKRKTAPVTGSSPTTDGVSAGPAARAVAGPKRPASAATADRARACRRVRVTSPLEPFPRAFDAKVFDDPARGSRRSGAGLPTYGTRRAPRPAPRGIAQGGAPMEITRSTIDTAKGPDTWFTGDVYIDAVAAAPAPARVQANLVHFTPGARTHWHTHPLGQTIYVTEGVGLAQRRGGPVEVIRPGDRVFFDPGEEHWHGAAPNRFMAHLAMHEADEEGNTVTWGEHVTDEEYGAAPQP